VNRGDVVVCIPVFGARELFEQCLRSVVEHAPPGTRVLVADDASPDPDIETFTRRVADEVAERLPVEYVRRPENLGFVANMNAVFRDTAPADVVIVNSDTVVPAAWLERLRAAAYSDGLVATASTLSNHGTILSVPDRDRPSPLPPPGLSITEADARIARASPRLYPRIPTGVGHCLYIRRSALELVGVFDETFSPGYGEEVDFSQRCLARGLRHVVADDLYVFHHGAGTFGSAHSERQQANEHELNRRYPYYARAVLEAATSEGLPLARSLAAARLAVTDLSVTLDGSCLGPNLTGTQVLALELAGALARRPGVRLRVTVPRSLGDRARAALDELGLERMWHDEADEDTVPTDIVHRPYQVTTPRDLLLLGRLGRRVVLTQLDSIAFHNPAYFADYAEWRGYRELTRSALAFADRVAFCSPHARDDARSEDLVDDERARLVALGIDHSIVVADSEPRRPAGLDDTPFLLCLGTDFQHKNLPFALELFERLRGEHGFAGRLVLAGPRAARGTSVEQEAAWRTAHPQLAADVIELGECPEAEKAWLYRNAALVLYPTTFEGFGFIPFEAAEAGTPSLWAPQSSMADLLPSAHAGIVPWDGEASAARAAELIGDPKAREALVAAVRAAGAELTWDRTAEQLLEVYRDAATAPRRVSAEPREALSDLAMSLVGPGGWLSPDEQQALLAVSTRPALKRTVFTALRGGYRAMYRVRRS
jgi:glycosyltransferase involved in cell wall biosynthesis/GT2 family glycosyltransferase